MTSPFPPAVSLVTVTGAIYGVDTQPRTGKVIFDLKQLLTDSTDKISIPPDRSIAILGSTNYVVSGGIAVPNTVPVSPGCFSIVLVATDYANLVASAPNTSWYYETTFDLDGSSPWTVNYLLPHSPAVVDVSQLTTTTGQN